MAASFLVSSTPKTLALPFAASPAASNLSFPAFIAFQSLRKAPTLALPVVPRVAFASDFEREQDAVAPPSEVEEREDLKLFVGNLPYSVDSSELASLFGQAGTVEMVEVIYDKFSGKSRGFGFVTMSSVEDVAEAIQQFNGYTLDGRPLAVRSGPPPRKDGFSSNGFGGNFEASNRVYVGNLSWNTDNIALETLFNEQGKVIDARVIYDRESGRSKGFGFVTFSSAEEVENAVASLNGTNLDGRSIRVSVAEGRPRRQF